MIWFVLDPWATAHPAGVLEPEHTGKFFPVSRNHPHDRDPCVHSTGILWDWAVKKIRKE